MGLLDFMQTPEGQGLLAATFGGLAGARKGSPINSIGRAGLAGLQGYSGAIDQQSQQAEKAVQAKYRDMQMSQMEQSARTAQAQREARDRALTGMAPEIKAAVDAGVPFEDIWKHQNPADNKPQLVTVNTPTGPMQRWLKPGQTSGIDIGAPIDKESAPPWYAKKGLDGNFSIDPAYADLKRTEASFGRAPAMPMAPVAYLDGSGNAVWGTITEAKGKPAANFSPSVKGAVAGAVESEKTKAGAVAKREINMNGLGGILDRAESILTDSTNPPTQSGAGTLYDSASAFVGMAPKGSAQADELRVIGGSLVSKMPRMEGPQSDKDVALYRESAGNVADSTLPASRRVAALKTVRALMSKYEKKTPAPSAGGAKFLGFE